MSARSLNATQSEQRSGRLTDDFNLRNLSDLIGANRLESCNLRLQIVINFEFPISSLRSGSSRLVAKLENDENDVKQLLQYSEISLNSHKISDGLSAFHWKEFPFSHFQCSLFRSVALH